MTDYLQIPYNRTLGRSLKILELLSEEGALSDLQISEKLNYKLLTVQQLLVVYKDYGYVSCDENGLYDLSTKVLDIGQKFSQRRNIKGIARSYLKNLSLKYNETTTLGAMENTDIIYVDKVDSLELLRFVPKKEQRITAHHTALGKSILAYMPKNQLNQYCQCAPWHAVTHKTVVSKLKLFERLKQIRKQGFALCDEEYSIGVRSIACAILDIHNYPRYSIGIWGPVERMSPQVLRKMQADLTVASREIGKFYNTASPPLGVLPARADHLKSLSNCHLREKSRSKKKQGFFQRAAALFL
jgi:DNA-binding IclR family transcriptional regulator